MIKTSIKSNSARNILFACVIAGVLAALSCGGLGGDFAFKKPMDDVYKKMDSAPEFGREESVDWVFAVSGIGSAGARLGVFMVKKELVWVEVHSRTETVDRNRAFIYGTIKGLARGRYKIIIAKESDVVGEKEFDIYDDADDGIFDR